MRRNVFKNLLSAVIVLSSCGAALADLTNGDFSSGLGSWTVESGTVTDGGGFALFQEHPVDLLSTLSQVFTIPTMAGQLSFDMVMSATAGGDYDEFAWPDAFTACLYDNPSDLNPLISNPGFDGFFYMDNTGVVEKVGSFEGTTVTLDVSAFRGLDAYLVFDLLGSYDGMETSVSLDNVNVSVVPAPGSLLLGLMGIGTGAVGLWRRFG